MKYLFILILLFISNFCYSSLQIGDYNDIYSHVYDYNHFSLIYPSSQYHYGSFIANPIIFRSDGKRYINDLSHEFPIEFYICGTYWKGGAWGYRNGFNNYYGNIYYFSSSYYSFYEENNSKIPEPSSLIILGSFISLYYFSKNNI